MNSLPVASFQQTARNETPITKHHPQSDGRKKQPGQYAARPLVVLIFDMLGNNRSIGTFLGKRVRVDPVFHRAMNLRIGKALQWIHPAMLSDPAYRQRPEPEREFRDGIFGQRLYPMQLDKDWRRRKAAKGARVAMKVSHCGK